MKTNIDVMMALQHMYITQMETETEKDSERDREILRETRRETVGNRMNTTTETKYMLILECRSR